MLAPRKAKWVGRKKKKNEARPTPARVLFAEWGGPGQRFFADWAGQQESSLLGKQHNRRSHRRESRLSRFQMSVQDESPVLAPPKIKSTAYVIDNRNSSPGLAESQGHRQD